MKTIAAISTSVGVGGIGIVRISGDKALDIIKKVFKTKDITNFNSHTIKYGHIIDSEKNNIDQVLVSYFKAPKTYTGEDVCEINCHGGNVVLKQILQIVLENGAVLAEAGEFTKRAFLNGKIDLSQAEAVIDIMNSKSRRENSVSQSQLAGNLGNKINEIKKKIIDLLVDMEANIDYPEYDIEEVQNEKIEKVLKNAYDELYKLEKSFESGKILRDGVKTVIVGKPNVGKSSLLNVLLKEERAIVTEIAGTTRDTIEEYITIRGIPLKIVDTAGIRKTSDIVEEIGVEKAIKAIDDADLILMLIDASQELSEEDRELLDKIKLKKHIVLINKVDLENKVKKENFKEENIIEISTKNLTGIEKLEDKIEEMFNVNDIEIQNDVVITNVRHQELICKAKEGISNSLKSLKQGLPIDMLSIDLQNSIKELSEITGESISEEVIKGIFSKFCLGK